MKKTISYKEISKVAGVSVSTISRYYNNGYVSAKASKRIEEVIKTLDDYVPPSGRQLRELSKEGSVFVVTPAFGSRVYQHIVDGIIVQCFKNKRRVASVYTGTTTEDYTDTIRYLITWKPSAIVVFISEYDQKLFNFLRSIEDVKIIVYGHKVPGVSWVAVDEHRGFYELTKYFKSILPKDNQRLIFLEDLTLNKTQCDIRYSGFKEACREVGVEPFKYAIHSIRRAVELKEFISFAVKNKFTNIICSSHNVYSALLLKGKEYFKLTDIGYTSVNDQLNSYYGKIFIDYPGIGFEIEKLITEMSPDDEEPATRLVMPKIIESLKL
ncbi:LacI family DNA-binding transcriptional regulator [Mycoplasma nasistruthionis]|uniref:LacI family transcriptional regulator n=1 Tax=Mycoplasma nasistruthionis TaxID=353852 RepID=A0A5B7XVW5_9MOLU|nr:LacI family DNA-binding transcriptional regulator [Mycoplasma nasistruthionis]QCZ36710.1 LacI family transcriptional regulator [Mycoplasma nasistruthionis]